MKNRPLCSVCLFLFLIMCTVIQAGGESLLRKLSPSTLEECVTEGEEVFLAGKVYKKENRDAYQILFLKDISIEYQKQFIKESRIILYDEKKTEVHIGQEIKAEGELSFFETARNPGNFDQKLYYKRQNIHAHIWAESIKPADSGWSVFLDGLYNLRQDFKEMLEKNMPEEDAAVLSAMILGEKSGMDERLREYYQVNGIGHVLAISGLHLSFVGIGIYKILRRLTGSYPVGGVFGILFLMLYILMIGFTVSAVRALVMFLFRVGADMTGRHYDAPTALSVAAVAVLLWRPLSLYEGGFWLSFGAVFAILAVVPVVQKAFVRVSSGSQKQNVDGTALSAYFEGIREHMWKGILQGLMASISINLVILPVLLYYFFEFPIYSLLLNLFVIPLMSVLLFLGMAGSLFSVCFLPLSGACFRICSGILRLYEMSCNLTLTLPGARFVAGKPEIWQIAVYYGILVIVLLLLYKKERLREYIDDVDDVEGAESKKYQTCGRGIVSRKYAERGLGRSIQRRVTRLGRFALVLGMAGIIILTHRWGERGKLTTVVLDVGQGDGIFMRGPEGGTYLMDGGSSDVKKVGQYRIEPFLKSQGVGVVDYVLLSHGDSDHMNGVEELIERQDIGVRIGTLVMPVQEVWDEALAGIAEKAKEHGVRVVVIVPGQSIKEGNMTITCIQPGNPGTKAENGKSEERNAEEEYEPGNAASMVLAVKFGEFDMLLTGDVEGGGEGQLTRQLEEQYRGHTWEVLKVAHHGSKNSSSEEFLRQVKPAYAFISAGRENRYGHPHQETIKRLTDIGSKIYSTQENGALIVEVEDGETMKVGK